MNSFFRKKEKKQDAEKQVVVGDFTLLANHDHLIEDYFREHKYYSKNLPRIAKIIETKYSQFSIIDVGANIGDTLALVRSEGVNQMMYCFEGEPDYFELLRKNVSNFSSVKIYKQFLGEETMSAKLQISSTGGTAKLDQTSEQKIELKKLDDIFEAENIENIKLLKVDTDGYDIKILRGSQKVIDQFNPVIFFEYDSVFLEEQGDDGVTYLQHLSNCGYKTILYYDNYGKFLLSTVLTELSIIQQLYNYIRNKEGAFQYFDLCIFHEEDTDLANKVIEAETSFFNAQIKIDHPQPDR